MAKNRLPLRPGIRFMSPAFPDIDFSAGEDTFNAYCLQMFMKQFTENDVYHRYCVSCGVQPDHIKHYTQIPFLPIEFFKTQQVSCFPLEDAEMIFESSSTTGKGLSRHYVKDPERYKKASISGFEIFFGPLQDYAVLALLPGYLERPNSSLVQMCNWFMEASGHPDNGFYLHQFAELADRWNKLEATGTKTLLIGVSHALLDFAEQYSFQTRHSTVIETGGMKGRRKELIRDELHGILSKAWGLKQIGSEYGMTELLSQAWSEGHGRFRTPPWMKILIRDPEDPFSWQHNGRSGGINVIDLMNSDSCAFIATSDLGRLHDDGRFEVLGRFDHSDLRGCSLLTAN